MLSVSYAGKNSYSAGKTSGVLRVGASGANRCYVLAHCAPFPLKSKTNHSKVMLTFFKSFQSDFLPPPSWLAEHYCEYFEDCS